MTNLIKKFQNVCFQNNLFKKGDKIILAVSGGPDSVCMLDIFAKIEKKYSLNLAIAHVNYNLRGDDSKEDEEFVKKIAEKYHLKLFLKKVSVSKKNVSENFLRNIRYDFFRDLMNEGGFNYIALGHNCNDQVETFLMRLIRGAGLLGLSSIKIKNDFLIRPMLFFSREEIVRYLKERKIKWRLDKTNLENSYLRNKIRNKLIPLLKKEYNQNFEETVFSNINFILDDYDYISRVAKKELGKTEFLSVLKLRKEHLAIRRRIILEAVRKIKGDLNNIKSANIIEINKVIDSEKSKNQTIIFSGLKIIRKGDKLEIGRAEKADKN